MQTVEQIPSDMLPLSPIIKAASAGCNIRCEYCFYSGHQPVIKKMDESALGQITSRLMEASPRQINFIWHGGEPTLLGIDFYQKAVDFQQKFAKPNQLVHNSMQTNGTLIDDKWVTFFQDNHWNVGISLDGPPVIHNLARVDTQNRGTFASAKRGLDLLRAAGMSVGCITVLNANTIDKYQEILSFFHNLNIPLKINRCTARPDDPKNIQDLAISPMNYTKVILEAFDLWLQKDDPEFKVDPMEHLVKMMLGFGTNLCQFSGACRKFITIDYNGDIYPCDEFGEEKYRLGNLMENGIGEVVASERFKQYYSGRESVLERCRGCEWIDICNGGCFREWGGRKTIKNPREEEFCQARQLLFLTIREKLTQRGYVKENV